MLVLELLAVWGAASIAGAAVFPLLYRSFPALRDRGWAVSRIVGTISITFLAWMASSLRLVPFGTPAVVGALVLLAAGSWFSARNRLKEMAGFIRVHRRMILTVEAVCLLGFFVFLAVIASNPEIAPETERFMDYALLNRIDQTSFFPPADPWFAGKTMNYYYYGYIVVAALHKLVPLPLPFFFNIVLGLIYALFLGASFGMGYNLTGKISYGFFGAAALMLIGNLYGFIQVLIPREATRIALIQAGHPDPGWLREVASQFSSFGFFDGARVMVQTGADGTILDYPINEFPFFSLIYGDLHPYVVTYMTNMAILTLLLGVARRTETGWGAWGATVRQRALTVAVAAVALGLLVGAHTWDYPVYLGVLFVSTAWKSWRRPAELPDGTGTTPEPGRRWNFILPAAAVAVLSFLLYLPFNLSFLGQQAGHNRGGLGAVGLRTPLDLFLEAVGIFLFFLAALLAADWINARKSARPLASPPVMVMVGIGLLVLVASGALPLFPTWLFVLLLAAAVVFRMAARGLELEEGYTLGLALVALGLALFCEFFFLVDHYQGGGYERMNTMFKFYTNIWLLLGTAAVYAAFRVRGRLVSSPAVRAWRWTVGGILGAGFVYSLASVPALARAHAHPAGLDGAAYILEPVPSWQKTEWKWDADDWRAAAWIEKNLPLDAVVLQANGNAYDWAPRIATFTGRPTLVGWNNHEAGWRNDWREPTRRSEATAAVYSTEDLTRARSLIDEYGIDYVYIGRTERTHYPGPGLEKFERLGDVVYAEGPVRIFRVGASR